MEEIRRVGVREILRARDERAARQKAFLLNEAVPLVSFTMNIAGDVKNDASIRLAFEEGKERIVSQLKRMQASVKAFHEIKADTGCEALWAVDENAETLKERMCLLEEADALGRLFDIDVIAADGAHLSRTSERACLICGGPVRACARSRAHSAEELFHKAHEIIDDYFRDRKIRLIGELAQRALLYEALTTPKPGLVDCENNGSHRDMDLFTFARSSCALGSYFEECAKLGMANAPCDQLQGAGLLAEEKMFSAAEVNTHQGAVFSLGILCYAAAGAHGGMADVWQRAAAVGTVFLNQMKKNSRPKTGGEHQYRQYGLTGARGEAASGFHTVRTVALPALERALEQGKTLPEAGLAALLALMAEVQDSNIIRRAGLEGQKWVAQEARNALEKGWSKESLREMNDRFVQRNISPGGSADLLATAYFLHFWQMEA